MLSHFIISLYFVLYELLKAYGILIIIYTLLTWIPGLLRNKVGYFLARIVEPYLRPFEESIPPFGGISFAPMVAWLFLYFVDEYVLRWIVNILLGIINNY